MTSAGAGRPGWARTAAASLVVGLATAGSIFAGMVALAPAAQAADDSSSAVTVTAREQDPDYLNSPFPDLSVTVSQTENLMSQGITLTYEGGKKSAPPSGQTADASALASAGRSSHAGATERVCGSADTVDQSVGASTLGRPGVRVRLFRGGGVTRPAVLAV